MISRSLSISEKRARLNDVAGRLAEFCQALYPLMVVHTDDFGRHAGDPFTVKHEIDPSSRRTLDEFARGLQHLHDVDLIVWYEHQGRKLYQIVWFDEHQPGLHKRTRSHLPEPPGNSWKSPELPSERNRTEENRNPPKSSLREDLPASDETRVTRRRRRGNGTPAEQEHVRKSQEVKRLEAQGVPRPEAMRRAGYQ